MNDISYVSVKSIYVCGSSSIDVFLLWTGGGTSPAQPPGGPGTPGYQNRTALTRTGAAWTSPPLLGASAAAGSCEAWGKYSHRRTQRSGRGGTASERGRPHDTLTMLLNLLHRKLNYTREFGYFLQLFHCVCILIFCFCLFV